MPDADQYRPPFPLELLADLHAGVLPEDESRKLWPLVRADADAQAVMNALDSVVARVGEVGRNSAGNTDAPQSMPADVAKRLDLALADAPAFGAVAADDLSTRRRRRRSIAISAALASVAAAFVIVLVVVPRPATPLVAAPTPTPAPDLTLKGNSIDQSTVMTLLGRRQLGPLSDPDVLAGCLAANNIADGAQVLGSALVTLDGAKGILLVLPGPTPRQLTALVVGDDCGAANPQTLARSDVG